MTIEIHSFFSELNLSSDQLQNLTLVEIEKLLQTNKKSLKDYPCMPYPNNFVQTLSGNRLIYAELDYNVIEQQQLFQSNYKCLTGNFFYILKMSNFVFKVRILNSS